MDAEHGSGISKHSETHPEVIDAEDFVTEGKLFFQAEKLHSSSSSSSDSSSKDLFVADTTSLPKPHEDAHPTLKDHEDDNNKSFSVSEANHESMLQCMSQRQCPPIQVMDRLGGSEGYHPNRIPSALCARSRSTTPVEWRVASNDSLFSIHVGNNSFSADSVLWLDGEVVYESGELTKPGELILLNPLVEPGRKIVEMEKKLESNIVNEAVKDETRSNAKYRDELKLQHPTGSWNSSSTSHFHNSQNSNTSESSTQSFSFPILIEGERVKADAEELQHSQPRHAQPEASSKVTSNSCAKSWLSCFLCWLPYCSCRCG